MQTMPFPPPFAEVLLARQASPPGPASVLASLIGVAGFIGLLIAAAYVRPAQELLSAAALFWFLGFGVVRIVLDLREPSASKRRDAPSGRGDRRTSAGLG